MKTIKDALHNKITSDAIVKATKELSQLLEWIEDGEYNYDYDEAFWKRIRYEGKRFHEEVYTTDELIKKYRKEQTK